MSKHHHKDWNYETEETEVEKASAAINRLPDAAFAGVSPGGKKDSEGKTIPRTLRHLPHHTGAVKSPTENTSIDKPLLRNGLARANQVNAPAAFKAKMLRHLQAHAKEVLPTSAAAQEKGTITKALDETDQLIAQLEHEANVGAGTWGAITKREGEI